MLFTLSGTVSSIWLNEVSRMSSPVLRELIYDVVTKSNKTSETAVKSMIRALCALIDLSLQTELL